MRTLIIRGSEWLRKNKRNKKGIPRYYGTLYDTIQDKMCCLGIMSRECGVEQHNLDAKGAPSSLQELGNACVNEWLDEKAIRGDNKNARKAMQINDTLLKDDDKIERLRPIFKDQGWEIDWRPNE